MILGLPDSLQAIELAAGEAFGSIGTEVIADDEPVGYIMVDVMDFCLHIAQVSGHPLHAATGLSAE